MRNSPRVAKREVHSTTRTTCPHSSSLEMSFAVLTAILTAARKRGIAAILRQTDDDGQTTDRINKTLPARPPPMLPRLDDKNVLMTLSNSAPG